MITCFALAYAFSGGPPTVDVPSFAGPVQLTTDGKPFTGILYPSPLVHDLDGDGRPEMMIGEIFGTITVARPTGKELGEFGALEPMKAAGKPIKLNNW